MTPPSLRVVRPVAEHDLDALLALAQSLGPGMTTLPADRAVLAAKIAASCASFRGRAPRSERSFLMVLEAEEGAILGTAALYPHVGLPYGFFSYKRLRQVRRSQALGLSREVELLSLTNDFTGATEVGTLAVRPDQKGTGAGKLLARSRYMLAGAFPDRFSPVLFAEMRGWQAGEGRSPFWDAVGAHFFAMDFATADGVSARRGADFIAELLPQHPLYVNLLPPAAREAIGRPHRDSAPAMAMLMAEGFRYEGYVDVFDAGPQVHCELDRIATVRRSARHAVSRRACPVGASDAPPRWLAANGDLARFRVVECAAAVEGTKPCCRTRRGAPFACRPARR